MVIPLCMNTTSSVAEISTSEPLQQDKMDTRDGCVNAMVIKNKFSVVEYFIFKKLYSKINYCYSESYTQVL